jgi:TolB protein
LPIAVALVWAACAVPALAAFPGENGKVIFGDGPQFTSSLFAVEPGGRSPTPLGSGRDPAVSPDGSRIAFDDGEISVMNVDGTGRTELTTGGGLQPAWSPDGSSIVFALGQPYWNECLSPTDLLVINATGEAGGVTNITNSDAYDYRPRWSPDGSKIAFIRQVWSDASDPPDYCDVFPFTPELYVINADGTGAQEIAEGVYDFDWSPDGSRIVYELAFDLWTIKPDGTDATQLTATSTGPASSEASPVWSPDGTKIAFESGSRLYVINADGSGLAEVAALDDTSFGAYPDWQALPVDTPATYIRPKSAQQIRVSLVPAFKSCVTPNREHGPPLAFGSCNPPQPESSRLSVGIGDGNPALARSAGFMRLRATTGDMSVRLVLTHVMRAADLSEYTGELRGAITVRRTDREPGPVSSTSIDMPLGFTVPCTSTPGSSADASNCATTTSVNAVVPGAIETAHRTVLELGAVRIYDGGPDDDADTATGNSPFATQGVLVP